MRKRLSLLLFALGLLFFPLAVLADEGFWYLEDFGVLEAHEEGLDGSGIKIADIDTIVNLDLPWLSDARVVLRDKAITTYYGDVPATGDDYDIAYHATDMISLLQGNGAGAISGKAPLGIVPGAEIYHYAAVTSESDDEKTGGDVYDVALAFALEDDVDIISIPAGGLSYYDKQFPYILEAVERGVPVLIAHDNRRTSIDWYAAPEIYQDENGNWLEYDDLLSADDDDEICYWYGCVTVQALNDNYELQLMSRVEDAGTDIAAPGEDLWMQFGDWGYFEAHGGGCSAATTLTAGYLALVMQRWPEATGNQILQLMIRTAVFPESSDLQQVSVSSDADAVLALIRDPYLGHGVINLKAMLSTDPSSFPDVNPVLYKDVALAVRNANASGLAERLSDPALLEVAAVLDAQLEAEDIARPDFLVTLLGERVTEEETDHPSEGEETDAEHTDAPAGEDAANATTDDAVLPADPPEEHLAGISAYLPFFVVGMIVVAALLVIVIRRPKKKPDS